MDRDADFGAKEWLFIDSFSEVVMEVGPSGRIVFINSRARRLFSLSVEMGSYY